MWNFSCLYEGWSSSRVLLTRESTKLVVCEDGTESQKTNNGSWLQNHRHVHLTFTSIQSLSKVHATSYISISGQARYLYPQVLGLKFKYQADLPLQMILRWVLVDGNQYFYQLVHMIVKTMWKWSAHVTTIVAPATQHPWTSWASIVKPTRISIVWVKGEQKFEFWLQIHLDFCSQ